MSLTHASIVVASIFGLFSILRIISDPRRSSTSKKILAIVYIILLGFGAYETIRYKFYSDRAKSIAIAEFGAEEWWKEFEFIKRLITPLFDYSWACYIILGLIAFVGGYDEFRSWIRNSIVKLKELRKWTWKEEEKPKHSLKYIKLVLISSIVLILLIASFIVGHDRGFIDGRTAVVAKVTHHESVSLNLTSTNIITKLEQMFPEKLNYTQLLNWESRRLNYTEGPIERHTNPIEILEYGLGRCGEFSILYVSICLANNVPARLVTDAIVDHVWAEVNPSNDTKTWIHIDPTESCVRISSGKSIYGEPATVNNPLLYAKYWHSNLQMVIAFQVNMERQVLIINRTSFYTV